MIVMLVLSGDDCIHQILDCLNALLKDFSFYMLGEALSKCSINYGQMC